MAQKFSSRRQPGKALSRRDLLKRAAGLGAGAALAGCSSFLPGIASKMNPVARENQRAGTRDWILERTQIDPVTRYRSPWIEGYCSRTSVSAGESIDIFVSTNPASTFTFDLYRMGYYQGAGARHLLSRGPIQGAVQPEPEIGGKRLRDCQWERSISLEIPGDWVSGVYLGKLTERREGWQSYVIFIVRDRREADFIFQCSDHTWQAYNRWPSQFSLYDDGKKEWYWGGGVEISFNRPYGKYCQILNAPLSTGSGEWFLWEFPIAYWLESLGIDVTYISNSDTHADATGLLRAKGFLSVGHDEYYTIEMFQNLQESIRRGLNVAFLSGNTCCGRIRFREKKGGGASRIFERIDVFGPPDPADFKILPDMAQFPHTSPNANLLLGARSVAPIMGGADWICLAPKHWLFEETGMRSGEEIPGLIGWEWHGDPASIPGLEILASGPTQSKPGQWNGGKYTATIYPGAKGNFVFNASTCWWGDGLSEPPGYVRPSVYTSPRGPDRRVQLMTLNLLKRARRSSKF